MITRDDIEAMSDDPRGDGVSGGEIYQLSASGKRLDLLDFSKSEFDLRDAANQLSRINRYNGAFVAGVNVAAHLLTCSDVAIAAGDGLGPWHDYSDVFKDQLYRECLAHDLHEYIVGDMTAPMKKVCPHFADVEARAETAVRTWLGLPLELPEQMHRAVKAIDYAVYRAERDSYSDQRGEWGLNVGARTTLERLARLRAAYRDAEYRSPPLAATRLLTKLRGVFPSANTQKN